MNDRLRSIVVFDFPGTLGSLAVSNDGENAIAFQPFADSRDLLDALASAGVEIGAVSFIKTVDRTIVQRALASVDLVNFFNLDLFDSLTSRTHLQSLMARVNAQPVQGVLVSHEAGNRFVARRAGLQATPETSLLPAVLAGEELTYVRVCSTSGSTELEHIAEVDGFEVLHVDRQTRGISYGIASSSAIERLRDLGGTVLPLCSAEDTVVSDLFLIQSGVDAAFRQLIEGLPVAEPTNDGWIIAVPGDRSIEDLHPDKGSHGHTLALSVAGRRRDKPYLPVAKVPSKELTQDEIAILANSISCADIDREVNPLIGKASLDLPQSPVISSRSVQSSENELAARHIAKRLGQILEIKAALKVIKGGLLNVQAELAGRSSTELVVIGAHLDSVALNLGPEYKAGSLAPGADDNASGVAGVLAVAKALKALAKSPPKRTIRFLLFNDEESGMTGSRRATYEIDKAGNLSVVAMLQMDMIGIHRGQGMPRIFEVHAPGSGDYRNGELVAQSTALRDIVVTAAKAVGSGSLSPQIYPEYGCDYDLGRYSSDHHQFLLRNWSACLVAEDFWREMMCTTDDANTKIHDHPGYHKKEDTYVCCDYAADIARVVAAVAWMVANG